MNEKLKGGLFDMRKEDDLAEEVIEKFLEFIVETIQRCLCIYNCDDRHGFDKFLIYELTDIDTVQIGCVEGGNFLLDSDFIYKHFLGYCRKERNRAFRIPEKSLFYQLLYRKEIICSYSVYFRRPLHMLRMGDGGKKQYFCIGKDSVGYTNSMLRGL